VNIASLENRLLPPDILDLVEDLICKTCHLNQDPPSIILRCTTPSPPMSGLVGKISPMASPEANKMPAFPDILEFILTQPPVLSDSSPETSTSDPPQAIGKQAPRIPKESEGLHTTTNSSIKVARTSKTRNMAPPPRIDGSLQVQKPIMSYAEAALVRLCKMCSAKVSPFKLMEHLTSHRPCTKRF
ncbi:hypothetical protein NPIL_461921, partial [Nephila pilipes]